MRQVWISELWRFAGIAFVAFVMGLIADNVLLLLLLAVLGYLGWHFINLRRLQRWLTEGEDAYPPLASGIWDATFNDLGRLQARNRKRKRKLTRILTRFEDAAAALPDAVVILGLHDEIEWFNDATQNLLGLHWPQDVGQRITNLVRHPEFIEFLAANDYSGGVELAAPANAEVMLAALIVPYGNERRLLVARDITHIRRLEQVRSDFVANVSHELRTPLTVINGFLETANETAPECPPDWRRPLQLMRQQAQRMQNIVQDLLLLSRLEMEQPSLMGNVEVPGLLEDVVQEARGLSGARSHTIQLDADPDLGLHGNADELRSAFSNLVFNAVQYTPEYGVIRVRWFRDAAGAHLVVSDTGMGIAEHHIPRLTERFYRVDTGRSRQSGGTGLGLAIVKHVLNRHAAQLLIESEQGKGSTFHCDFPLTRLVHLAGKPQPVRDTHNT